MWFNGNRRIGEWMNEWIVTDWVVGDGLSLLSPFPTVVDANSTPQSAPPLELDDLGAMQRLRPPGQLDLSSAMAHKAITPEDDLLTAQGRWSTMNHGLQKLTYQSAFVKIFKNID